MKIGLLSLGCPRNLVDSELILGSLKKKGYSIADIEKSVDVAIVNTCSFVESARQESVETILQAVDLKKKGRIKYLIVAGCLAQGHHKEIENEIGEIDAFVGTSDFHKMPRIIESLKTNERCSEVSTGLKYLADEKAPRYILTPSHYAYLKISEGCDNLCSYCIISSLRGRFRSRRMGSIIKEADAIARAGGAKEINIIGQDTTMYGVDIYGKPRLEALLKKICALRNSVKWLRLLYTHPAHYTDALIKTIAEEGKICKYLDLPIQHISDRILKAMNRKVTSSGIKSLIDKLRERIEGLTLRTSVIVGFPGETDTDFNELIKFLRQARFERLGAFIYSRETGTPAHDYKGQVPLKVKEARLDEVMKVQRSVSEEINKKYMGGTVEVLIDEYAKDDGVFLGRTRADAPEVDGIVYVKGKALKPGDIIKARIVDTLEYDLVGEAV